MIRCHHRVALLLLLAPILLVSMSVGVAGAQGFSQLPVQSSSFTSPAFSGGGSNFLQSYLSSGKAGAGSGDSGPGRSLGIFSAGYNYNSFNFGEGIRYNELILSYYLPGKIGNQSFVTPFALAYITSLNDTAKALGFADAFLRFGGSWHTRLPGRLWVGIRGEYDATRSRETWYSGGQARIELFQLLGQDLASLRITYYADSSGTLFNLPNNPSGYEAAIGYSHELFTRGPRLRLIAAGYEFDAGIVDKQRGWYLATGISSTGDLFTLRGKVGQDSIFLGNYSLGADVNLPF